MSNPQAIGGPAHVRESARSRSGGLPRASFHGTAARARRRRGFTMLEMVLVLAVMTVIISISWPLLMQYVRRQDLGQAGIDVRHELAGARLKAIDNGLVYQFRYEPGGRWYVVLPYDRPDVGSSQAATGGGGSAQSRTPPTAARQLPASCQFQPQDSQPAETIPAEWLALLPQTASLTQVSWSSPIGFFLDGSASGASIVLQDQYGNQQTLTVRSLTGGIEVSPLQRGAAR